jgi:hypothetical protein
MAADTVEQAASEPDEGSAQPSFATVRPLPSCLAR